MKVRASTLRALPALVLGLAVSIGCATAGPGANPAPASAPAPASPAPDSAAVPLFPTDGVPAHWIVRDWSDVAQPAPPEALWEVRDGILRGSTPRGTWLVSEEEFSDFELEFEFRLGERGNAGVGLRVPPKGDPAFEAIEIQLVDPRFYGTNVAVPPWNLTGSIYRAVAPSAQMFRPGEWNACRITCRGPELRIAVNGREVVQVNLDNQIAPLERGKPLSERPRRGRIAFQELSRGNGHVEIRQARMRPL